jgi:hypothetical protein
MVATHSSALTAFAARLARRARIFALLLRHMPAGVAIAIFLSICLRQLELPGLYYDEALDLTPMLTWMHGGAPELLRGIGVGRFPVMLLDYMGSLGGYVTVPFLWIFGSGVAAARLQPILFSAVTILLVHVQARRWFGPWVAGATVLLLAVQPSFVWFTRQGISVTSVMTVFAWSSLLLLHPLERPGESNLRRGWRFVGAGIMLGLGLWAKLPFLWWLMMLAAMAVLVLLRRGMGARLRDLLRRAAPFVALGFAVGAAPLLYYNFIGLLRDGQPHTAALIFGSVLRPTQQFGVDNLDFATNLATSWSNFKVFIDGSYFWYNGVTFSNVYALPVLGAAAVLGVVLAPRRRVLRRWLGVVIALPVAVFMGSFTVSGQWATHFFIIAGLPQLVVACAAVWIAEAAAARMRELDKRVFIAVCVLVLMALPAWRDVWVNQQHHAKLAETGGSGRFSDAVYKLAQYLDERARRGEAQPAALDWGIEKQIRVLTDDRVQPIEIFGYSAEADDGFRARAREMLIGEKRVYVVLWDRFAVYNRRSEFTRLAEEMGMQVTEAFIAHERSGLPVYVVLEAK